MIVISQKDTKKKHNKKPDSTDLDERVSYELDFWRRGRDSNSRYGCPHTAFREQRLQPLGHLSLPLKEYLNN